MSSRSASVPSGPDAVATNASDDIRHRCRKIVTPVRQPKAWPAILGLVVLLAAAGCSSTSSNSSSTTSSSSSTTVSGQPARAQGADAVAPTCSSVGVFVQCVLASSTNELTEGVLLGAAQAIKSSVSGTTPMVITAYGGTGGQAFQTGGGAGSPGEAQTTTTIKKLLASFGTTTLYYYLGSDPGNASGGQVGGQGGASTIVATADLTSTAPCISDSPFCTAQNNVVHPNIVLVAGGGGGGSQDEFCNYADGGTGGQATAPATSSQVAAGETGHISGCQGGGKGGGGGDDGNAGSGGGKGSGADAVAGLSGNSGIGGLGGPVHISSGPTSSPSWVTIGALSAVGSSGAGGEGEVRGAEEGGGGGGGGGGYGGGGGGGAGGYLISGGGGGGGGSYAFQQTVSPSALPTISTPSGDGEVVVSFIVGS
jgi:hypothetical protein